MASVDFLKIGKSSISGTVVHFDEVMRKYKKHANTDINPELSHLNYNLVNFETNNKNSTASWQEIMQTCINRINEIDEKFPPERVRDDRKEAVYLYTPCPHAITEMGKDREFFEAVFELQKDFFGNRLIGMQVHMDEVHDYMDHGKIQTSLVHSHSLIVADAEWDQTKRNGEVVHRRGINAKHFNTPEMYQSFQDAMQKMVLERFGVSYQTGESARKSKVEELKLESYKELKKETKKLQRENVKLANENAQLSTENKEISAVNEELEKRCEQIHAEANNRIKRTNAEITQLKNEITVLNAEKRDIAEELRRLSVETEKKKARFKTELMEFTNSCIEQFLQAKTDIERNQILKNFHTGVKKIEEYFDDYER